MLRGRNQPMQLWRRRSRNIGGTGTAARERPWEPTSSPPKTWWTGPVVSGAGGTAALLSRSSINAAFSSSRSAIRARLATTASSQSKPWTSQGASSAGERALEEETWDWGRKRKKLLPAARPPQKKRQNQDHLQWRTFKIQTLQRVTRMMWGTAAFAQGTSRTSPDALPVGKIKSPGKVFGNLCRGL